MSVIYCMGYLMEFLESLRGKSYQKKRKASKQASKQAVAGRARRVYPCVIHQLIVACLPARLPACTL